MNVLIVEDEVNNVEVLEHLLSTYCNEVSVIGNAPDVDTAIDIINNNRPDLVLLDVELKDGTGFDVLNGLKSFVPKVIFITGYQHYAIEAIKMSAIDYILKPVNIDELISAIEKARELQLESQAIEILQKKVQELEPTFVWLNDSKKSQRIETDKIEYIKADAVYSEVYMDSGKIRFTSFALSHFEKKLPEGEFYRIHNSYIVNLNKVMEVEKGRGGSLFLLSGTKLPIAYRRKTVLKQLLQKG